MSLCHDHIWSEAVQQRKVWVDEAVDELFCVCLPLSRDRDLYRSDNRLLLLDLADTAVQGALCCSIVMLKILGGGGGDQMKLHDDSVLNLFSLNPQMKMTKRRVRRMCWMRRLS